MANQPSLVDRLIFWVLGSTLLLSIGLLPNVLFSRYMESGAVHRITYVTESEVDGYIHRSLELRAAVGSVKAPIRRQVAGRPIPPSRSANGLATQANRLANL